MAQETYCDVCVSHIVKGLIYRFTVGRDSYAVCDRCRTAIIDADLELIDDTEEETQE